jgi:hypothetical protein
LQTLRAMKTLQAKPNLARLARLFCFPYSTGLIKSAVTLLAKCLRMMENLVSVSLAVVGQYAHVLRGCTFTPRVFKALFLYDEDLKEWLETRGRYLEQLRLPGVGMVPFRLSENSLPRLAVLIGAPRFIIALAPGRPIRQTGILAINKASSYHAMRDLVVTTLRAVALSSSEAGTVTITISATDIMFFVDAVMNILPQCRVLYLHMLCIRMPSDMVRPTLAPFSQSSTTCFRTISSNKH